MRFRNVDRKDKKSWILFTVCANGPAPKAITRTRTLLFVSGKLKIIGDHAITYWLDDPVKIVMVVDVRLADR